MVRRMLPQTSISQDSTPPPEYWLRLLVTLPFWPCETTAVVPPLRRAPVPV